VAPMLVPLLLQVVGGTPEADCALTGLCGLVTPVRPVASGIFFVAVGLVALGIRGLRRRPG
jgi:hypothetical protein